MYIFDTDTLNNIVKKKPSPMLIEKLRNLPRTVQPTTSVNIGEIYYGAYRSPEKNKSLKPLNDTSFRTSPFWHLITNVVKYLAY